MPVVVVAIWQLAATAGAVASTTLPAPLEIARAFADFLAGKSTTLPGVVPFSGAAGGHVSATLYRLASAYALAVLVGVPLGLGLGLSRPVSLALDPLVQALRPIPIFAWLPLAITWFGLGGGAARFLVFIGALFPIVITTADGAGRVPRVLVDNARMLGTPRRRLARRVYLPASLPSIVTGLRLGLSLGWMSVIVGELTGTRHGIGVMMTTAREVGRLDRVIVGMVCFAVLGLSTDLLLRAIARPYVRWSDR